MEENLAEAGVDIGNVENVTAEEIPSDQEIETLQETDKTEISDSENNKNIDNDFENNSISN